MNDIEKRVQVRLFEMQDLGYRDFHAKLMPTVPKEKIIGVRVPLIRKLAAELGKTKEGREFLRILPHKYYEEDNVHAFLIEQIKDFNECISALDEFLLYVDNWATCDMMTPKVFKKNTDKLLPAIYKWLQSDRTYTVRFAIGMLMKFYLDENFDEKYLQTVADVKSEEYYVNMMIAWYFATALAKQWEKTVPYIENGVLDKWIHNKTIQKAVESYRITKEQKLYLKTLKIK